MASRNLSVKYGKEYQSAANKRHYKKHREKYIARSREPDARLKITVKRYGLTFQQYKDMFFKQRGLCAVCKKPEILKNKDGKIRNLSIDHDHETEKVRALLCFHCNTALRNLCDDPEIVENLLNYIRAHKE